MAIFLTVPVNPQTEHVCVCLCVVSYHPYFKQVLCHSLCEALWELTQTRQAPLLAWYSCLIVDVGVSGGETSDLSAARLSIPCSLGLIEPLIVLFPPPISLFLWMSMLLACITQCCVVNRYHSNTLQWCWVVPSFAAAACTHKSFTCHVNTDSCCLGNPLVQLNVSFGSIECKPNLQNARNEWRLHMSVFGT